MVLICAKICFSLQLLQVAMIFAIIWSPVEAQIMDPCKLRTQQLEKNIQRSTMKVSLLYLKYGRADYAYSVFLDLPNHLDFLDEFIASVYWNSTVELYHLTDFIYQYQYLGAMHTGINFLYEQMKKKNQSEQRETIPLYYKVQEVVCEPNINNFYQPDDQKQFHALNSKLTPIKEQIVNTIVNDIKSRKFNRSIDMMDITEILSFQHAGSFFSDVFKQYLASTKSTQFSFSPELLDFIQNLNLYSTICKFYGAIWEELRTSSNNETMEALVVWSHASEIKCSVESTRYNYHCWKIAAKRAPAYRKTLFSIYTDYIKKGKTEEIRNLHEKYRMRNILANYIISLSSNEFQILIIKLLDAISALPYVADKCFATSAVSKKILLMNQTNPTMIGSMEHLQTLQIVKRTMNSSDYVNLDEFSKTECESVQKTQKYFSTEPPRPKLQPAQQILRSGSTFLRQSQQDCTWIQKYLRGRATRGHQ
jgi:hemerythrin superfamily protein